MTATTRDPMLDELEIVRRENADLQDRLDAAEVRVEAADDALRHLRQVAEVDSDTTHEDLVAELKRLRADNDRLSDELHDARDEANRRWDQAGDVRLEVMQAIYDAGVHEQVCDDDPVPDMVRQALAVALNRPVSPAGLPGYTETGICPEGAENGDQTAKRPAPAPLAQP